MWTYSLEECYITSHLPRELCLTLHRPLLHQDLHRKKENDSSQLLMVGEEQQGQKNKYFDILINTAPNTLAKITMMTLCLTINFKLMKAINLYIKSTNWLCKWFSNQQFDDTCQEMANKDEFTNHANFTVSKRNSWSVYERKNRVAWWSWNNCNRESRVKLSHQRPVRRNETGNLEPEYSLQSLQGQFSNSNFFS